MQLILSTARKGALGQRRHRYEGQIFPRLSGIAQMLYICRTIYVSGLKAYL
jgi:hypothetical protein